MAKEIWKPGTMVYPVPAVMVTVADREGRDNIITVAWTGTVCSDPAMTYISVRKSRHSYQMIEDTGEFVINLTTKKLTRATDYCGVKSGRDVDKFAEMGLTRAPASKVKVPLIAESPVNIECKVVQKLELGTHDMFLAEVLAVQADTAYMDDTGRFRLYKAEPVAYCHGGYYGLGELIGTFGYSVKKPPAQKRKKKRQQG